MSNGEIISKELAKDFARNFRDHHDDPNVIRAYSIDRHLVEELINGPGCTGIRVYNGIDEDGKSTIFMVATDDQNNDLVDHIIIDRSRPCPNYCSADGYFSEKD